MNKVDLGNLTPRGLTRGQNGKWKQLVCGNGGQSGDNEGG